MCFQFPNMNVPTVYRHLINSKHTYFVHATTHTTYIDRGCIQFPSFRFAPQFASRKILIYVNQIRMICQSNFIGTLIHIMALSLRQRRTLSNIRIPFQLWSVWPYVRCQIVCTSLLTLHLLYGSCSSIIVICRWRETMMFLLLLLLLLPLLLLYLWAKCSRNLTVSGTPQYSLSTLIPMAAPDEAFVVCRKHVAAFGLDDVKLSRTADRYVFVANTNIYMHSQGFTPSEIDCRALTILLSLAQMQAYHRYGVYLERRCICFNRGSPT